jgi:hypothetical protein
VPPEVTSSVVILLMEDILDFEESAGFEVKTFITSCQFVLRWRETRFWTKLRYILPDPLNHSGGADATAASQTLAENIISLPDMWGGSNKELPDSSLTISQQAAVASSSTLNNRLDFPTSSRAESASSLRFKSRSRASVQAAQQQTTVDSNSEFIYLTPKPKKARCQGTVMDEGGHQRSSSEIYLQQQQAEAAYSHQRSRSALVPSPTSRLLASNQNLLATILPSSATTATTAAASGLEMSANIMQSGGEGEDDPARQIYGSTSFIYRLISSNGGAGGGSSPMPFPSRDSPAVFPKQQQQQRPMSNCYSPSLQLMNNSCYSPSQQQQQQQLTNSCYSPSQQLVMHQRSKSSYHPASNSSGPSYYPDNSSGPPPPPAAPPSFHSRSQSHLLPAAQYPPPPPPGRVKLSRSSSQLSSTRPSPLLPPSHHQQQQQQQPHHHHTLAAHYHHRRDPSHPTRLTSPYSTSSSNSSDSPVVHQRSKSTPYKGFVV